MHGIADHEKMSLMVWTCIKNGMSRIAREAFFSKLTSGNDHEAVSSKIKGPTQNIIESH